MTQTIIGVFASRADADTTIDDLKSAGFDPKDISIVMRDNQNLQRTTSPIADDTASGIVAGGVIGGIAGLLIGIGAIAIPGIGGVLIGGPIAAALGATGVAATTISGVATGVIAGGIVGALAGIGVPEEEAHEYERRIKEGAILIAVAADSNGVQHAKEIFADNHADKLQVLST